MRAKIVKLISKYPKINIDLIFKDLLLTEILEILISELKKLDVEFCLKGGTCLSKCYLNTNRLSEDIDITILSISKEQAKIQIQNVSKL